MHIAILGFGRFGHALSDLAIASGLVVTAFDSGALVPTQLAKASPKEAILGANIVILAMPVSAMEASLREIASSLTADQLVLDVGSVKVLPSTFLARALGDRVPFAATHPLFGPTSLAHGERPLRVIVCPNETHATAASRARAFYESLGCEVLEETAEEHDRAMARTHALTFFLAKGVLDAFGSEPAPVFTPASFQGIARAIESVRADAGHLFRTLQIDNPYAADSRRAILDALVHVDRAIAAESVAAPATNSESLSIPDLGAKSPELREARALIDDVDAQILSLLKQRAELAKKAAAAKSSIGATTFDPAREAKLLEERRAWGKNLGLAPEAVDDVFEAILRLSRSLQRKGQT